MATVTETRRASLVENESMILYVAAALAFTCQAIHLWLMAGEILFAFLPGMLFLIVSIGQGLLGVRLLFGPGAWTIRFGVLFNLVIASAWALTRFVSFPNATGTVDSQIGIVELTAAVTAVGIVVLLVLSARQ